MKTPENNRLLRATSVALSAVLALPLAGMSLAPAQAREHRGTAAAAAETFDALVLSKTAAFRHGSIPTGVAAIEQLADGHGSYVPDADQQAARFAAREEGIQ